MPEIRCRAENRFATTYRVILLPTRIALVQFTKTPLKSAVRALRRNGVCRGVVVMSYEGSTNPPIRHPL